MIKEVVLKKSNETKRIKTFPQFHSNKLYITVLETNIYKLNYDKLDNSYIWLNITNNKANEYLTYKYFDSFEAACRLGTIYILDNKQDLACFIFGHRGFPTITPIVTLKNNNSIRSDEVSIDNVCIYRIYATYNKAENKVYRATRGSSEYEWLFSCTDYSCGHTFKPIKETLQARIQGIDCDMPASTVYQFDTEEEYLRWALEKTTGKTFRSYTSSFPVTTFKLFTKKPFVEIFG